MESPPRPAATRARYPSSVLLDTKAYFDDGVNSTTAHAVTPAGEAVRVTFCLASPPFISHFCLPSYYRSGPIRAATVVSSAKDLVLLRVTFAARYCDYFVYQAAGNNPSPSLRPIPPIHPGVHYPPCVLPCDDDGDGAEFLVADLSNALDAGRYVLDVFSSKTNAWVTRRLQLQQASPDAGVDMPGTLDKAVWLGGGSVAWIDLWQGIIMCDDVRDEYPVLRTVPLPKPGSGFSDRRRGIGTTGHRQQVRDVTFCDSGFFRFVEMDWRFKRVPVNGDANHVNSKTTSCDLDIGDTIIHDSEFFFWRPTEEYAIIPDGWKIRTCYRHVSWDYWREGHVVDSNDITVCNPEHRKVLPQLWDFGAGRSTLGNLAVSYPTLGTGKNDDDVVYLMCKVNIDDRGAWMVAVDLGKKTVEVVENIADYFQPPFLSCSFSEYLNATPKNACCNL